MKLSEHKALKAAILALPPKEKDKLLLRLVAKDKVLTERFHFLLLEEDSALRERTDDIKEAIKELKRELKETKPTSKNLLINLRKGMKLVNHFFKVTKAAFEEVELRVFLFNTLLDGFKSKSSFFRQKEDAVLVNYIVKAMQVSLKKMDKLHPDLQFDITEEVNRLLGKMNDPFIRPAADAIGLPKQL